MNDIFSAPDFEHLVQQFNEAFDVGVDLPLQFDLVNEEAKEFMDAAVAISVDPSIENAENLLKEIADFYYVMTGVAVMVNSIPESQRDASVNVALSEEAALNMALATMGISAAVEAGFVKPDMIKEAFYEVHRSNMSKLDDEGKPIRREDGKVLKGPNYSEAGLRAQGALISKRYKELF